LKLLSLRESIKVIDLTSIECVGAEQKENGDSEDKIERAPLDRNTKQLYETIDSYVQFLGGSSTNYFEEKQVKEGSSTKENHEKVVSFAEVSTENGDELRGLCRLYQKEA
jgi:hypothetical protein